MALTDIVIKSKTHKDVNGNIRTPPYKLGDEKGLYLYVQATGGKLWRFDYRFLGKRKTLAIGSYPDVTLVDARERRDQARKLLASDPPIDPSENKKAEKAERKANITNTFGACKKSV